MYIQKNDILYYARVIPGICYDVLELKIRTVKDDWFVGIEKRDKQAFLFNEPDLGKIVFQDRTDALKVADLAEKKYKELNELYNYENSSEVIKDEHDRL